MNRADIAKLLAILNRFDARQIVDDLAVAAWHSVPEVASVSFEVARDIAVAHQTGPQANEVFAVRHLAAALRRRARTTPADIAADIRSARARGIIPADWPTDEPLTPQHADALAAARDHDRAETARYAELEESR